MVGPSFEAESFAENLQHHAHGGVDGSEGDHLATAHDSRVGVGEHGGMLQYFGGYVGQILQRRPAPRIVEPLLSLRVTLLRMLSKGEERLGAAQTLSCAGYLQRLLRGHVEGFSLGGRLTEGAVAAEVAAQPGQGNEHLGGEGDDAFLAPVAKNGRGAAEALQVLRRGVGQRQGLFLRKIAAASPPRGEGWASATRSLRPGSRRGIRGLAVGRGLALPKGDESVSEP